MLELIKYACVCVVTALLITPHSARGQAAPITTELLDGLRFRSVGPAVAGGRIHDVEALPHDPSTIYLASASGGIWKSTNKGTTWAPIFDDQPVSTFGDIVIAPSNPDIIWAGTGEQNNRQSTSWGNGVYLSRDGGRTWQHRGLDETRHTGQIVVHPDDPDIAFVGALGNLWAPSRDRGVYKTTNGGGRWSQVLYVDELTGIIDLVMDPSDPNVLYAAAYQRLRRTWGFNGGGPGSAIYKTTDGGRNWRALTTGLPAGDKGRIGLAIARTNPQILVAIVEHATARGIYRTEDGGETWTKASDLNPRPMYYSHIYVDPTTDQRIYVLATSSYVSEDGGRTFTTLPTRPTYDVGVHSDFHDLWINPNNPDHFYLAGDGGLHETWDMGQTFIRINNIPIGQFYAIGADNRDPYWVYGGMQDNHSWMGPSATRHWIGIINDDWRQIGFGDGMYQQPDPTSHRYVYVLAQNGDLLRVDAETGDHLNLEPLEPEGEPDYRFDWVTPSLVSRHDPNTVYLGGNRLFMSRDRGVTWDRTEDLTRQVDRETLELMGVRGSEPMLSKNDGTSSYGEIVTIAESPIEARILWIGTDDGNVQVSRDGGTTWTEISGNVPGLPDGTYVSRVAASVTALGTAYVTFDAHRDGDFAPYVYRATDFGLNWEPLMDDLPSGSVNVIVEHAVNPNLLFLGTEHALYVSTNAGASWARFRSNLPTTLYDDLIIHSRSNDLIVGTHGRSIWILDDLSPLVEWSRIGRDVAAHLFTVRPATIHQYWKDTSYRGQAAYAGENPPYGAIVNYYVGRGARGARVIVTTAANEHVRTLDVPGERGLHRVTWDLRHPPPPSNNSAPPSNLPQSIEARGPFVSPGSYRITLDVDGRQTTQTVRVLGDPQMNLTAAQWREREEFLLAVSRAQQRVHEALEAMGDSGQDRDSRNDLRRRLQQLRGRLGSLAGEFNGRGVRQGSLYPPTNTHRERWRRLNAELEAALRGAQ